MLGPKRLQKELVKVICAEKKPKTPPRSIARILNMDRSKGPLAPGITLVSAEDLQSWYMDVQVMDNPIYSNEVYRLHFRFSNNYPIEAPEVVFVRDESHPIPIHPHIYSNGIICLDLLDSAGWSPVHNVESVCVSIQSMLTGNTKRERPPGDAEFVRSNRQRPKDISFLYHDTTV